MRHFAPLHPAVVMMCTALAGCDFGGIADIGESLLDPDAALLDRPGRQLASGTYSGLVVDGSLETGGSVVAFRSDGGQTRVAIVPFLEGEPCEVSPGVAFERVSSRIDVALPNLLAVKRSENESGRGRISFVGHDCEKRMDDLEDASMPRIVFPSGDPRGVLTLTGDGVLHLIDAEQTDLVRIADQVSSARVAGNRLLTIERGELVIRDDQLEVTTRIGTGVEDLVTTGGERYEVAFVDETGINVWGEGKGVTLLSETGCELVDLSPDVVAFFDPCEERRLNVQVAGRLVGHEGDIRLVGPAGVIQANRMRTSWGLASEPSELTFLTADDPDATAGTLRHVVITEEAEVTEDTIAVTAESLAENAGIANGQMFENWDGNKGTLVTFEREDGKVVGLSQLAEGVVDVPGGTAFAQRGVLARFEDGAGTLLQLSKTKDGIDKQVLGEGVPLQSQAGEADTGNFAFVRDAENGVGALALARTGDVGDVARDVFVNTARFLDQPRGLAYLAESKGGGIATLRTWLIDSELELEIKDNVSEYRTLPWPSPGILYAVPDGEDAGLWFSKAR